MGLISFTWELKAWTSIYCILLDCLHRIVFSSINLSLDTLYSYRIYVHLCVSLFPKHRHICLGFCLILSICLFSSLCDRNISFLLLYGFSNSLFAFLFSAQATRSICHSPFILNAMTWFLSILINIPWFTTLYANRPDKIFISYFKLVELIYSLNYVFASYITFQIMWFN